MIVYFRGKEIEVNPVDLGGGVGEVPCFRCGGSGDWTFERYGRQRKFPDGVKCVHCKGTGKVLISI